MEVDSTGLVPPLAGPSSSKPPELRGPPLGSATFPRRRSPSRGARSRSRGTPSESAVAKVPRAWVDLFSPPSSSPTAPNNLSFIPPSIGEAGIFVDHEEDDSTELEDCWRLAIVGYVIGLKLSFKPLQEFISKVWKPKGEFSLHMRVGGFFVCKFSLEEDLLAALGGFWSIRGHPFLLQRWRKDMKLEKAMLSSMPIWVTFPNLPLHLWSRISLSKLSSALGKPLFMDKLTASKQRLSLARVCIIIDSNFNFPSQIHVRHKSGEMESIDVQYDWKPKPCSACFSFGHADKACISNGVFCTKEKYLWKPTGRSFPVAPSLADSDSVGLLPSGDLLGVHLVGASESSAIPPPLSNRLSHSTPNLAKVSISISNGPPTTQLEGTSTSNLADIPNSISNLAEGPSCTPFEGNSNLAEVPNSSSISNMNLVGNSISNSNLEDDSNSNSENVSTPDPKPLLVLAATPREGSSAALAEHEPFIGHMDRNSDSVLMPPPSKPHHHPSDFNDDATHIPLRRLLPSSFKGLRPKSVRLKARTKTTSKKSP